MSKALECTPSRFLDEVPEDLLNIDGEKSDPKEAQEEGRATLNSLRDMLNKS